MAIIYPLAARAAPDVELSQNNFAELERVGRLALDPDLRGRLSDLAHFWVGEQRRLTSPRPKQFRQRLQQIEKTLKDAHAALDLNRESSPMWERHLFNWIRNSGALGAEAFFEDANELLMRMQRMRALAASAQKALPHDAGRSRPYEDERLIVALSTIFEAAGGTAAVYSSEHAASGVADTPFRRFAHTFYRLLPMKPKRSTSGLDQALRLALRSQRRRKRTG
jgi:hypothetical protein